MGLASRVVDVYYTFRFLKALVTPWKETDAFKQGVVDADGKQLKKVGELKTSAEKDAYNMFFRLVFNIKRLINLVPGGKSKIASYAAALYLIKEETGMTDASIKWIFEHTDGVNVDMELNENRWYLNKLGQLQPGSYELKNAAPITETGEFLARAGSNVIVEQPTSPCGSVLGNPVFMVTHSTTKRSVAVSLADLLK